MADKHSCQRELVEKTLSLYPVIQVILYLLQTVLYQYWPNQKSNQIWQILNICLKVQQMCI